MTRIYSNAWMLLAGLLILKLACTSDTITPQPSPTSWAAETINASAERMIALKTASFQLTHEDDGSTALSPGITMQRLNGRVDIPGNFDIELEGEVTFGPSTAAFIKLKVVAVGDRAFITNIVNPKLWNPTELSALPFNLGDLGRTLGIIIQEIEGASANEPTRVDGENSIHIVGTVPSASLSVLVPEAVIGVNVGLELWIGQDSSLLRKVRIVGPLFSTDSSEVVRVLTIFHFDVPVEIVLPDLLS